jgi:MYXO-CTERM domain-containing protein
MPTTRLRRLALGLSLSAAGLAASPEAAAFCGFYVSGADAKLFNNATMVVLMREGTRTVLSMQNNYQGPPEDFAMVVPVPIVLQKENVKTLPDAVFDRVDQLAAPRLVEYWEQDPCMDLRSEREDAPMPMAAAPMARGRSAKATELGVTIEAQFEVGEYEIVILSAKDSLGLDTWLRQEKYKIPEGAEPILRPYVQGGMKFFVAKVNVEKVTFQGGMAKLSPLRFHYDTETFSLPVRLGLLNSSGKQDLIVHILARRQRYELSNYKNVSIPTNLDVAESARDQFGPFYAALFDRTLEENPGAIVTEYAWDANTCDPCPTPALTPSELSTLGADVLPGAEPSPESAPPPPSRPGAPVRGRRAPPGMGWRGGFVLTRLHARYGADSLGEDLVFRAANPIMGGREQPGPDGKLETGAREGSFNNFQGRYSVRHLWSGPIACAKPRRGIWGGPPQGGAAQTKVAQDLAFAPRGGVQIASMVRHDVPEIRLKATSPQAPRAGEVPVVPKPPEEPRRPGAAKPPAGQTPPAWADPSASGGCGCAVPGAPAQGAWAALAGALAALAGRARRRRARGG